MRHRIALRSFVFLAFAAAVFAIDSSIVGLHMNQAPYLIFVNVIPLFIYVTASLLAYITLRSNKNRLPAFLNLLRLTCVVFALSHIVIILVTRGGIDLSKSRYEVLSGAVVPSLAIIAVGLLHRLSKLDVFTLTLNLLICLLSVTRTLLVVLALQILGVFLSRPSAVFRSATYKGLAVLVAGLFLVVAIDLGEGAGLSERWLQRITVSNRVGLDPTALTRSAEVHFMMEHFQSSTTTLLFGNGLAAVTSLTGPDAARAAHIVGWGSLDIHSIGYGHQNYASMLFVAGLIGSACLIWVQLASGAQSLLLIRKLQLKGSLFDESTVHIGTWGGLIVIGMLGIGLLGGTLADRTACLWFGVGTGMLYWARDEVRAHQIRTRAAQAVAYQSSSAAHGETTL
jgi:hypothetical protein